jgi:tetratricopeptide (TPR) repeat protein
MELNHCQDVREVLGLLYYYTGNMYFDDQDYRSAGMYYSGVWTLRSIGVRDLYYGRGNAYISNGDYDKAIEFFSLSEGNRDERTYQALAKAKELKRDAEEAAKRAVEQAEEAAKQAAKEAAQAALDATPPVPVGTGYDRVPWGASIESVKNIYQDSQLKTGTEGVELIQKNVGGGISNRTFGFIQDKLIVVREVYEKTNEQGADLVVKKLTATYGKPKETASETDRYTGIDMTVSIWEYNKKTEITLTKLGTASRAKQNQQKLELVRQLGGQFGAAMAQQVEVLADPSKALCDFWIDYKDMAGFERIRKEKK